MFVSSDGIKMVFTWTPFMSSMFALVKRFVPFHGFSPSSPKVAIAKTTSGRGRDLRNVRQKAPPPAPFGSWTSRVRAVTSTEDFPSTPSSSGDQHREREQGPKARSRHLARGLFQLTEFERISAVPITEPEHCE
ncbi:hypothetical protein quinque_008387 [Culex quinquefasciatus]